LPDPLSSPPQKGSPGFVIGLCLFPLPATGRLTTLSSLFSPPTFPIGRNAERRIYCFSVSFFSSFAGPWKAPLPSPHRLRGGRCVFFFFFSLFFQCRIMRLFFRLPSTANKVVAGLVALPPFLLVGKFFFPSPLWPRVVSEERLSLFSKLWAPFFRNRRGRDLICLPTFFFFAPPLSFRPTYRSEEF